MSIKQGRMDAADITYWQHLNIKESIQAYQFWLWTVYKCHENDIDFEDYETDQKIRFDYDRFQYINRRRWFHNPIIQMIRSAASDPYKMIMVVVAALISIICGLLIFNGKL